MQPHVPLPPRKEDFSFVADVTTMHGIRFVRALLMLELFRSVVRTPAPRVKFPWNLISALEFRVGRAI
jgi:hypothetical protein